MKTFFGLPKKVVFCKKTLISNQRPNSSVEFIHNKKSKKKTLYIDRKRISDSWKYSLIKKKINFEKREKQLLKLLDKHRGKYGKYDCIVPGSGGKDSCYAAHILKYKYGMSPLTVTWSPIIYTDYGHKNFLNWVDSCKTDNITADRNEDLMIYLTKQSILNLLHPFQTFILGQKNFPVKIAIKYKIPLVFYGENEAEHGNPISHNSSSLRNHSYYTFKNLKKIYLGGKRIDEILNETKFTKKDIDQLLPIDTNKINIDNLEVHYLGYYLNWVPQETYYYSVQNCKFRPRPFRTEGTYSRYISIDDKIDDLHFYTTFIKFGIGRATYDVSQEIRNSHMLLDEGKKLIDKFDGEKPKRYFLETLDYLGIDVKKFNNLCDNFRSPHLWKKVGKEWRLRHTANKNGTDD